MRDPEIFPALESDLFGEVVKRMKVEKVENEKVFVPEELKALRKELKVQAKSK